MLDLGAKTGLELKAILQLYPDIKVTCIDFANEMLKKLKEKYNQYHAEIVEGSYFEFPFPPCDAAVLVESLHHFTQSEKIELNKKLYSLLTDGECFVLTNYFFMSDEEEKSQQVVSDELVHYDTPLTINHEIVALRSWEATSILRAYKRTKS